MFEAICALLFGMSHLVKLIMWYNLMPLAPTQNMLCSMGLIHQDEEITWNYLMSLI